MQPLHAGPANRSRVVKKWLKDNHVPVLECPRNSSVGLKPNSKCLELYEKQSSGSTFH